MGARIHAERSRPPERPSLLASRGGKPLPPVFRQSMEGAFRSDFTRVRVFESPEAERIGALAFTRGESVHVAPGVFSPGSSEGRRVMAHELAHVEQQRRGIVRPTGERGGYPVNDAPRLEQAAEHAAGRAVLGDTVPPPPPSVHRPAGNVIQCMNGDDDPLDRKRKHKAGIDEDEERADRRRARVDQAQAARERELERRRQITALTRKSTEDLKQLWLSIKRRALKSISAIEELSGRLRGADALIARRLAALDNQAQLIFENFDAIDARVGRRQDPRRDADKKALAAIILEGHELQRQLGEVSSRAEGSLSALDAFQGDLDNYRYHTGRNTADAIPITWYKAPDDYKDIVIPPNNAAGVAAKSYKFPNGPKTTDGFTFDLVVAADNRPALNNANVFVLQKQAIGSRPTSTPNKDEANQRLKAAGYGLRDNGRKLDGDHVRDLGFGGDDTYDNYWPLETRVNQRAYFGYNRNYVVNFIDHKKDEDQNNPNNNPKGRPTSQPIGGLVGRYFKIKDYMDFGDNATVPAEGKRDDTKKWSGTGQFN